ncbi:MAG: histidine phosphatase family protein, partial [Gaiellaceae bacterium]
GLLNGDAGADVDLTEAGVEQARALGRALAAEALELCVVTELVRTRRTAAEALAGRAVPLEVWPELNDPRAGSFEGLHLDAYRAWAWSASSSEDAPGGGESRAAAVARYASAYRALLARREDAILAVVHALPIAYVLAALAGEAPAARMDRPVPYAEPFVLDAAALAASVDVLEAWCAAPTW